MNLRLDSKSIRVRVSHQEALQLAKEGMLSEWLPLAGKRLELRLQCQEGKLLFVESPSAECVAIHIPLVKLHSMLTMKEVEMRNVLHDGLNPIEIRFEIDRFTLKNQ